MPLRRVKGQRPLWGLGQRPNCSSSNLLKGRSQAKSRQRSVPRPNFARPQTRPQSALFNVYAVSRRWRDRTACLSDMAACFYLLQGFRACGSDQRAMKTDEVCGRESVALRSPPTPLRSALPCFLTFSASYLYYFQIHLRHLLAPFPFWRPLIPLSVALLRCVSFTLARMKNSRRILAHSYLEIV